MKMNSKQAFEARDKLAIEGHEILHLVIQINERLQNITDILDPKLQPIDMSKAAIVEAIWEQNADRSREDVEAAVFKHMDIDPNDMRGTPFLKEELTGNMEAFINYDCEIGADRKEKDEPYSTDYQHWEQMYNQSQAVNAELMETIQVNTLAIKAMKDMLDDYIK